MFKQITSQNQIIQVTEKNVTILFGFWSAFSVGSGGV